MVGVEWGGDLSAFMAREEVSLLAEELIQLTVKSSLVKPRSSFSLLCSGWTNKQYNPNGFRAQVRSIWKTKRKFDIHMAGQNLFQFFFFEDEDDLEAIMNGRPWLFKKQLIIFERLTEAIERNKVKLIYSSFWLRLNWCPPECDKKDLMHAIGSTFGGVLRLDINEESCRIQILLDARKPLRRGIFIAVWVTRKVWLPFKYDYLPNFYFGCGIMGHLAKDCVAVIKQGTEIGEGELPYSVALKIESKLVGRESLQLGMVDKKFMEQCLYTGEDDGRIPLPFSLIIDEGTRAKEELGNTLKAELLTVKFSDEVKMTKIQHDVAVREADMGSCFVESDGREKTEVVGTIFNTPEVGNRGTPKQSRWTRKGRTGPINDVQMVTTPCKRKLSTFEEELNGDLNNDISAKKKGRLESNEAKSSILEDIEDCLKVPPYFRSAAAKRHAHWSQ